MRSLDQPTQVPSRSDDLRALFAGIVLMGLIALGLVANAGGIS
jgi:hypothetical protein